MTLVAAMEASERSQASVSTTCCQEHGIFRTFSVLFLTTFYVVLPLSTLFSQFHSSRKDNTRAIDPIT